MAEDLNSALTEIGLTQYEAKIYKTLTGEGVSTAKDVSNICGIPYGKIYEVISSLSKKGFIEVLPTKPMKYRALDPCIILKSVKEERLKKLNNAESIITAELRTSFEKTKEFMESKGYFWIISGRMAINKKIEELLNKANNYVYIYTTAKGMERLSLYNDIIKKAAKRGVDVKISASSDAQLDSFKFLKMLDLKSSNLKLENHLVCIDGKEALIYEAIPDDESTKYGRDIGMWVSNVSFTDFIETLFLTHHNSSRKVE